MNKKERQSSCGTGGGSHRRKKKRKMKKRKAGREKVVGVVREKWWPLNWSECGEEDKECKQSVWWNSYEKKKSRKKWWEILSLSIVGEWMNERWLNVEEGKGNLVGWRNGGDGGALCSNQKDVWCYLRSDTFKLFLSFTILYFSFPKGVTCFFTRWTSFESN